MLYSMFTCKENEDIKIVKDLIRLVSKRLKEDGDGFLSSEMDKLHTYKEKGKKLRVGEHFDRHILGQEREIVKCYNRLLDSLFILGKIQLGKELDNVTYAAIDFLIYVYFIKEGEKIAQELKSLPSMDFAYLIAQGYSENKAIAMSAIAWYCGSRNINNNFYVEYYRTEEEYYKEYLEEQKSKSYINGLLNTEDNPIEIAQVDLMTGSDFEGFVCRLFTKLGYKVRHTKVSGDQGVDVVATQGNRIVAIQTKCQKAKVSNAAVQEVVAGKVMYNATECMVVTNSYFTQSAVDLAKKNKVTLWDRNELIKRIQETGITE